MSFFLFLGFFFFVGGGGVMLGSRGYKGFGFLGYRGFRAEDCGFRVSGSTLNP